MFFSVKSLLITAQFRWAWFSPNSTNKNRAECCVGLTNELSKLLQWEVKFPELLTLHLSATSDQESCSLTSTRGSEQRERKRQFQGEKRAASRKFHHLWIQGITLRDVWKQQEYSRWWMHHHIPRLLPNGSGDAQTPNNIHGMFCAKISHSDRHLKLTQPSKGWKPRSFV